MSQLAFEYGGAIRQLLDFNKALGSGGKAALIKTPFSRPPLIHFESHNSLDAAIPSPTHT